MRDQVMAPRFDSRPAWWIFREILRRMDIKEALDFDTIEELWNYQLDGTGVTIADMRAAGIVAPGGRPDADPRAELTFPTPSGTIEIESDVLERAGLPSLAPYEPKAAPTGDRFNLLFAKTATLAHGQSLNNPILNEIAPEQVLWIHPTRAEPLGIADGDEVEVNGGGRYSGRLKAKVTPWIHPEAVFMLHGYGATVPLATRALGLGVADQRLQHGKLYDFDPAGGGCALTETLVRVQARADERREPVSTYILLHDQASCIGCLACEVHCKTNKDLGPGPDPCKIITSGPVDVDGQPRMHFAFMPCFHCEDRVVREGLPDRRHAPTREGRHRLRRVRLLRRLQELHHRLPVGHATVGPGHPQGGQVRLLHGSRGCRAAARLRHEVRDRLPLLR